jgi:hypothetical protein
MHLVWSQSGEEQEDSWVESQRNPKGNENIQIFKTVVEIRVFSKTLTTLTLSEIMRGVCPRFICQLWRWKVGSTSPQALLPCTWGP